ncbi:hypothetical protein BDF20DRAFT_838117 [Mycotypha africana]|uniref:uncharacterized protein n=1 Tax=Mycotypha africana TaxID=64632 RepID=UPI002300D4F3|nr:uncharacterized protein BDF20DRAFT_838117 [Mycotypha africana]KAI8971837.1 hypothetical protein BDF20DRAFT_838117 [Mycotypha africana]
MVAFSPIEDYSNFDKPINIITPNSMHFSKELKNISVPNKRTIPICITAAVYRISAGNSISSSFNRHPHSDYLPIDHFWTSNSPWDTYRHLFVMKKTDEYLSSSCSSTTSSSASSSTCSSSRSESPEPSSCAATVSTLNNVSSSNDIDDDSSTANKKHHHHHHHHHTKRSCHMLLREIRRLRGENHSLRTSVSVLQNDLRDINLSRQYTDASHKKFYDEYIDKNTQLEIDIMDRDDEIKELKKEIARLKAVIAKQQQQQQQQKNETPETSSTSFLSVLSEAIPSTTNDASRKESISNDFACFDYFEKEAANDDMSCQPVAAAYDSIIPDMIVDATASQSEKDEQEEINAYFRRRMMDMQNEDNSDDDGENNDACTNPTLHHDDIDADADDDDDVEDEEEHDTVLEPFETVAPSYIHQALLSKLSSTRVRLEIDELILKYEPTADMITQVLAISFVQWLHALLSKNVDINATPPVTPAKVFSTKIQNGIAGFWQSILQLYTSEEESQLLFLNHLDNAVNGKLTIVENFDRLVFMLYKYNVIDDDAALDWWHHPSDNDTSMKIRQVTHKFAEWLEEEDEEVEDDHHHHHCGHDDGCYSDSDIETDKVITQNNTKLNNSSGNKEQNGDLYDSYVESDEDDSVVEYQQYCNMDELHDEDLEEEHFSFDETFSDEEQEEPVVEKKKKTVRICV